MTPLENNTGQNKFGKRSSSGFTSVFFSHILLIIFMLIANKTSVVNALEYGSDVLVIDDKNYETEMPKHKFVLVKFMSPYW